MHKSILYLLGLLVMLLPFGTSSMSNSNAMAIGEEYDSDYYQRYAMDMLNDYEDLSSYANEDYDSEYPSYKSDYNEEYKSYGNNDYKSKDSNSISISKIKCENVNNNFNNVVIGNLSIGNSGKGGSASDDRSNGVLSANAYSGNNGERYNNGYQKDKDVTCIINNNNTIITEGGGNVTEPLTCEECFIEFLSETQIIGQIGTTSLEEYCNSIEGLGVSEAEFRNDLAFIGVSPANINALIECLINAGIQFGP